MNCGVTATELVVIGGSPADALWPGSPATCPSTLALARQSVAGWSPGRHHLFHVTVRSSVRVVYGNLDIISVVFFWGGMTHFSAPLPPLRRVTCPTWCPCLSEAGWCM